MKVVRERAGVYWEEEGWAGRELRKQEGVLRWAGMELGWSTKDGSVRTRSVYLISNTSL